MAQITARKKSSFGRRSTTLDYQFGRSLSREKALSAEPFLAYALNGEPLTKHQGAPLRLIVPGWYGVANVKWLAQIHAQEEQYLGKYQARWYRTVRGEMIDGEMRWNETAVTHMQLKSFIARVTRDSESLQGTWSCAERRHAPEVRRGQGG
jgi:DMSO/TMAO reductase YedYZ molybdopterin-dependent catalytic subunit